ncbi:MAG TPA: hypothetical protein VK934_05090 [Fimbriimonas sp.]|nr:hypothetical protein [Fimbriimonas sp.]
MIKWLYRLFVMDAPEWWDLPLNEFVATQKQRRLPPEVDLRMFGATQ